MHQESVETEVGSMKTIWVIDDDEGILEVVNIILTSVGYQVKTSLNGQCFQNINKNGDKPDLILLDVLLSGEDGRDICKRLKSQEKTKDIPIIMLSAHSNARKIKDLCGAEAFLAKPFDVDELIDLVDEYVRKG
jgi:DNA-binding response OmpR family regulator